jgi:hypothetical protein
MPCLADGGKHREAVLGVSADDAIYLRQMPFYLWAEKRGCLNRASACRFRRRPFLISIAAELATARHRASSIRGERRTAAREVQLLSRASGGGRLLFVMELSRRAIVVIGHTCKSKP